MEKTKIVIVYEDSESDSASVYINNPHADTEELLTMLAAHAAHFIRNMSLENVPASDAVEMIQAAVQMAVDYFTDNDEKGVE
ncbi:MAG: hypothetical protein K2O42_03545 [Oscillospiraceae bacterium]|nr:hypothetical protein [Oscillospiraceae bacterium]